MDTEPASLDDFPRFDIRTIRDVLCEQFPDLRPREVSDLGEGADSRAFLVDNEWVFRFPKRREVEGWLVGERVILQRISRMPLPVQVPRPEFLGVASTCFPFAFVGYPLIPGTASHESDPSTIRRDVAARQLGSTLSLIHSVTQEECRALGLRHDEYDPDGSWEDVRSHLDTIGSLIPNDLKSESMAYLEGSVRPPRGPVSYCLIHNDLAAEHLLMAEDGTLSGLIDWGDASSGDPAADFAWPFAWLGKPFVASMLAYYDQTIDSAFWDRIVFYARRVALESFVWRFPGPQSPWHEPLRYLRNAFSNGEDDHQHLRFFPFWLYFQRCLTEL